MPTLRVTVNDVVVMDGDLGKWSSEPPFITEQQLAIANKQAQPWSMPLLMTIRQALMGEPTRAIDIHTRTDGWTLEVHN